MRRNPLRKLYVFVFAVALGAAAFIVLTYWGIIPGRTTVRPNLPQQISQNPPQSSQQAAITPAVLPPAPAQPWYVCPVDRKIWTRNTISIAYAEHLHSLPPDPAHPPLGSVIGQGKTFGGLVDTTIVNRIDALYTAEALARSIQGTVTVLADVGLDGIPTNICAFNSPDTGRPLLGYGLDEAAVAAMRQWRFKPATIDGNPVVQTTQQEFNFKP